MQKETFFVIASVIIGVLTLITIAFALSIIAAIVYHWRGPARSITNLLTCNSCIALLYHSLATSLAVARRSDARLCRLRAFMYFNSCTATSYSYLIQAVSRYFITIHYRQKTLLTFRIHHLLIGFDWLVSALIAASMLITPAAYQYEPESRMCLLTSKVFASSFTGVTLAFCIPFLVTIFLYALILYHTTHNPLRSSPFAKRRLRRDLTVFRTILMFVGILALGGTPYFLCVIINPFGSVPWPWYMTSIVCISLSGTLEALALFLSNTHVRTQFGVLICRYPLHDASNDMVARDNPLLARTSQI